MAQFTPQLIVLSAPSGTGKTSILSQILKLEPHFKLSVSYTTRAPREGEIHGIHYYFITTGEFEERIAAGDFLEWAKVHQNYYGTSISQIKESLATGHSIVLDIDVQGAMQLKEKKDLQGYYLFLCPPNVEELEKRLRGRGTESEESVQVRLSNAKEELSHQDQYDIQIINDQLSQATLAMLYHFYHLAHYQPTATEPSLASIQEASQKPEMAEAFLMRLQGSEEK